MAKYPSVVAVMRWHDYQIEQYGGSFGIHDANLLASAVAAPRFVAQYHSRDIPAQAATLCYSLAKNHPFRDGNKRTALMAMLCFLSRNGYQVPVLPDEWADIIVGVAEDTITRQELTVLIRATFRRRRS